MCYFQNLCSGLSQASVCPRLKAFNKPLGGGFSTPNLAKTCWVHTHLSPITMDWCCWGTVTDGSQDIVSEKARELQLYKNLAIPIYGPIFTSGCKVPSITKLLERSTWLTHNLRGRGRGEGIPREGDHGTRCKSPRYWVDTGGKQPAKQGSFAYN